MEGGDQAFDSLKGGDQAFDSSPRMGILFFFFLIPRFHHWGS